MAHKRENRSHSRKSKWLQWSVFIVLLCYLLVTLYNQQDMLNKSKTQYQQAISKLESEKQTNLELEKEFASIGTDEFYEKVAREVFGYVKPGERIFHESKN